jgi:hypothetical protein
MALRCSEGPFLWSVFSSSLGLADLLFYSAIGQPLFDLFRIESRAPAHLQMRDLPLRTPFIDSRSGNPEEARNLFDV